MIRQQKYTSAAAAKKAAAALRAQLHQELESKKQCTYQPHECTQLTLEGFDFCLRHIMEDKTAPYRQCSYMYNNNGKRCHLPAPKGDKKEHVYCSDHAFKCHLTRVRAASRHQPTNSMESMLDSLSHHVTPNSAKSTGIKLEDLEDDKADDTSLDLKTTKYLDPFNEVDSSAVNASRSRILDFGSESESDVEAATYTSVWHDAHADSSDDESIDSEQEDILKHAGIYTAEEVTLVTRDKLIRLQSLYIEQFKHLQHILKERRRKYLHSLKREKDTLSNIHNQMKETPKEKRMYKKLKSLNHYHKKHGIDAIMNKKFTELRARLTDGTTARPNSFNRCTYVEGGCKCGEKSMPMAKHCRKHILSDRQQILFKRCSRVHADFECREPVLAIFKDATCKFHMDFPAIRHYGETRTFEDSDMEDSSSDHPALDIMASSSCDSKAPATITSSQLINFSNQFPSQPKLQLYEDDDDIDEEKDDVELDLLREISNEISIDDAANFDVPLQEESSSSLAAKSEDGPARTDPDEDTLIRQELEEKDEELAQEIAESEMSVIDPDDDMAGIMLELQRDNAASQEGLN